MTPVTSIVDSAAIQLLEALLRVTLDGALVALPVWLACRFVPSLPASARAWLWWAVSLKLLLSLTAAPLLSIPVLPASWTTAAAPVSRVSPVTSVSPLTSTPPLTPTLSRQAGRGGSTEARPARIETIAPSAVRSTDASLPWNLMRVATAAWAIAIAIQFVLLAADALRLRGLLRRATRSAPAIEDEHEDLAKDLGLRSVPALRESREVMAPQVVGLLRPTVLLPAGDAAPLSPSERTMVLCHELAHVRRGDLVLGWIPALAERLLVWHPLARLCAREYALAREAACDALVLRTLDAQAGDYGRLLLRLGVNMPAARIAAAGTSPTARLLRRRLHMLQQASLSPRAITGLAITAALVALVPLRLVAVPAVDLAPIDAVERSTPAPADAAVDRSGAPQPVVDVRERHRERGDGHAWIYFYPDSDRVMMSGDTDDIAMAKRLRGERGRAFFVFRKGGEVYTIVDEPTLARIAEIFEPQRRLGEEQGQLGARQGELGSEQGRLGARQGMLGAEQGGLGLRQAQLSAQLAEIEARRQRVAIDRLREGDTRRDGYARAEEESRARALAIERDLREIDARHAALAEQHEALGREQEALGRRQGELGAEQERLGAQQARIAVVVERQLTELLERAVAEGIAKSVR